MRFYKILEIQIYIYEKIRFSHLHTLRLVCRQVKVETVAKVIFSNRSYAESGKYCLFTITKNTTER
jgi:hypothetical protein